MSNWVLIILLFTHCGGGRNAVTVEQVQFRTEAACIKAKVKLSKWEDQRIRAFCNENYYDTK